MTGGELKFILNLMLMVDQVRAEVEAWCVRASNSSYDMYVSGMRRIRLSDGRWVTYDEEPGWLRINGERVYSAAWL